MAEREEVQTSSIGGGRLGCDTVDIGNNRRAWSLECFLLSTCSNTQSINTQDSLPTGITWNDDGTKLYEVGRSDNNIYEYDVSTAFDISTASFSQSINTQDGNPTDVTWNNDGTKMYEIGSSSDKVYEYDVSTAFDISTASFSQSINIQDDVPTGMAWNDDGTKMYEIGTGSDNIYEWTLSTAFDISTASFSQSTSTQSDEVPSGISWDNSGTKMFEIAVNSDPVDDKIYEYDVSTAFDISTASFDQSIVTQDDRPRGMAWNNDGSKLYEIGNGSDKIYEYDCC